MPWFDFMWTDATIQPLAEHGIEPDDYEEVVCNPVKQTTSRTTGKPAAFGYTTDGRYLFAVYEMIDPVTVLPVTAFKVKK